MASFDKTKALLEYDRAIQPRLSELTEPLRMLGVSNFSFSRDEPESVFRIGNYPPYTEHYMRNDFYKTTFADRGLTKESTYEEGKRRIFVWGNDLTARKSVNMWNGISIYNSHADHVEAWTLGGTLQDTELPNFLLNNLDLLNRYFNYFKTHAQDIIGPSAPVIRETLVYKESHTLSSTDYETAIEEFNRRIETSRYTICRGNETLTLSQRELECLLYRHQGLSAKEMARILGISHRTVESYFENIKVKSGLGNINQVLAICRDEGLI